MRNYTERDGVPGLTVLYGVGALGLLLALVCGIDILIQHRIFIVPEGNITKPLSFDLSIGLFTLTTAAILPIANFTRRGYQVFVWTAVLTSLYAYMVETVQPFRGLDPRFSHHFRLIDGLASMGFALDSLIIIVLYIVLMVKFFRTRRLPIVNLAIRYSMAGIMGAFAAGVWMIVERGRYVGAHGNIIWVHAFGINGIETILLFAAMSSSLNGSDFIKGRLVHFQGLLWILFETLIAVQTARGDSIFHLTVISALAAVLLLLWCGIFLLVFVFWCQRTNRGASVPQV
ncbi:hypothetical protein [Alicyclobacillus dauci]|uniref:Uncharacterized protein n=1 Tax=Alicyclobacillus dauci TaxID=1475485 RepID=A0ABY6Z9L7_9BACL|nr:hypothetical protein [Alicyclobacillus dauci]WAH38780.1 hypothetical protein NZD86_10025 [Alicyclobacillus dauci]